MSIHRAWLSALVLAGCMCGGAAAEAPSVGAAAKDVELPSLAGETVKLSKLTATGPVVLVVLRGYPGYQCPICTKQYSGLLAKAEEFKKAGAQVLLVYPGPAAQLKERAAEFVKGKDYPAHFHFLLDADYAFTNAYGLRWEAKNETAYPSTFVIGQDGKIRYAKVSKGHGDRAKVEDVLGALKAK